MSSNYKKFILLWIGSLISIIGGGLTSFGLGVYVFNLNGSAYEMSLITLLGFLPSLVLSVPAGALCDKYDRRLLMMLGDGLSAFGIIYILINYLNGDLTLFKILLGVSVSSVFSSLIEPAFKSTITEILDKNEYSKASGLLSLTSACKYVIAPVVAGFLLSAFDISVILIIDICTFFVTLGSVFLVSKSIKKQKVNNSESIKDIIVNGLKVIKDKKGILYLILISSVVTMFIGSFQTLAQPLILSFTDSKTLGIGETICAFGMIASSLFLGLKGLKKRHSLILGLSLIFAGISMIGFGLIENVYIICLFGFLFFAMLPIMNNCLDFLIRINIPEEKQGRVWGMVGFILQIGYVIAFAFCGMTADLLSRNFNISVGRGAARVLLIGGVLLIVISLLSLNIKSIRKLDVKED